MILSNNVQAHDGKGFKYCILPHYYYSQRPSAPLSSLLPKNLTKAYV
jgi:hypothetical protein